MDDLDKMLYEALSKEKIEKEISMLKEKQENATTDFDKYYWGLRLKEWDFYFDICKKVEDYKKGIREA